MKKKYLPLFLAVAATATLHSQTKPPAAPVASAEMAKPAAPLSKDTLARIARMTPIFDGRSLNGWIQAPPAPVSFSREDVLDLGSLVTKITQKADPISAWLSAQMNEAGKEGLKQYASTDAPADVAKKTTSPVLKNINNLVGGENSIYDEARFKGVKLRPETEALLRKNPKGMELARLNRLLLEDAYPQELAKSPSSAWVVKDGAMASTGAGRGVIFSEGDFSHYRVIFNMRHVSGKPDHQPCVLVFCTRPAAGERGLDALGGIQFQVPNGGHWDYRPGHNNGGTGFTNPIKTKYDNHEWSQVEILVNAKDGTARMAVAQPVGTRGIENLVFKDPEAGKAGPLAWQMHNAGLFDEFKDVRIEIDPQEDRLITVE
jgi:hypothetical protein